MNNSFAHDAPAQVNLYLFVKPEGKTLNVLMRVPTEALGEIDFPKRSPGYFDFAKLDPVLIDAVKMYVFENFTVYENDQILRNINLEAARVDLPSDESFSDYDSARKNIIAAPLDNSTDLYWNQGVLDVWIAYQAADENAAFYFVSTLDRLGESTTTVVRFLPENSTERVYSFTGNPGKVALNPSWFYAAFKFVSLGFEHILLGFDHLLFLFCLIIPVRRIKHLIPIITAFTLAHSITLIGSALGVTISVGWFPPLIELLIAASIVYMAFENILGLSLQRRWLLTFLFGLIHGFGFSFILSDSLQFAGTHLITSLLAFNIGVELGQCLVVLAVVPMCWWLFNRLPSQRVGVILLSALVAHEAWHWLTERLSVLLQYQWQPLVFDGMFLVGLMRWGMLLIIAGVALWAVAQFFKRSTWLKEV